MFILKEIDGRVRKATKTRSVATSREPIREKREPNDAYRANVRHSAATRHRGSKTLDQLQSDHARLRRTSNGRCTQRLQALSQLNARQLREDRSNRPDDDQIELSEVGGES